MGPGERGCRGARRQEMGRARRDRQEGLWGNRAWEEIGGRRHQVKGLREVGSLEGKGLKCPNSEPLLPDGLPNPQPLPRPGHLLLGSLEPWF